MEKKIKIGVMGGARGKDLMRYCKFDKRAELVAVCDKNEQVLKNVEKSLKNENRSVDLYDNFEDFVNSGLNAVILANYADEHVPFAIKCLKKNISVLSEVVLAKTLKEVVELCDAVEESDALYAYGENYCYFDVSREMKRLCDLKLLGEIEYAEGEYVHNCENIWHSLTYGDKNHWRNKKHAFYYCTHSLGPIIHATKLRPASVVGFEGKYNDKMYRMGAYSAPFAIEQVVLENGAIVKSLHGELAKNSIYYSIYGSLGRIESARSGDKAQQGTVYVSLDPSAGQSCDEIDSFVPENKNIEGFENLSYHAKADYEMLRNFISALCGEEADVIDVYEAADMFLPGIFAYKSVLNGGAPQKIPDFRNKIEREKYRDDVSCVDEKVAGDKVLPSYSKGNAVIPDEVYDRIKQKYLSEKTAKTDE